MHLLASYMPVYDRGVRHTTDVRADAATVSDSIWRTDFGGSEVVRALLERTCGAPFLASAGDKSRRFTLGEFRALGCVVLSSCAGREVALGAMAAVSAARFELFPANEEQFRDADEPGVAKLFWHFSVMQAGNARSTLTLETRLRCAAGGDAQRLLLPRWDAFEPLGARARREVLLAMKTLAESAS